MITLEQKLERARLTRECVNMLLTKLTEAEPYLDGIRVTIPVYNHATMYVYALPWARGWSVFASDKETEQRHTWREVPKKYAGLQNPVYCPRDVTGPWNVSQKQLESAVRVVIYIVRKLDNARRKRAERRFWYWPRTALSRQTTAAAQSTHAAA